MISFSGPPSLSRFIVYENASIGHVIGFLNATDVDNDQDLAFSLLTDAEGRFKVVGSALKVNSKLNFEERPFHPVTVQVRDSGSPRLDSITTVNITVLDANDAPSRITFQRGLIPEHTQERQGDVRNGTTVGNLSTVDEDVGQQHTYEIVNTNEGLVAFGVNYSNLVVSCAYLLDFETRDSWFLVVKATDSQGASVTSQVAVRLRDVNERPQGIVLSGDSFMENAPIGTVVGSLSARDPDTHDNHTFVLSSIPGNISVVLDGCYLKTARIVDHETEDVVHITVSVTDKGGLSLAQDLTITVLDQNEAPTGITLTKQFANIKCHLLADACIAENQRRGYPVARITAQDPDQGDTTTCDVLNGELFTISNTDLVVSGNINYESLGPSHVITVVISCRDKGGLATQETFNVSIVDANDPIANVFLSHRVVSSSAPVGSLIGRFEIEDEDASDHHYCVLLDPESPFKIEELQLKTKNPLINATLSRYPVHVLCSDFTAISFPKTFFIEVKDMNMSSQINLTLDSSGIAENLPAGSEVGRLLAMSFNPAETLVFQLDDSANGTFALTSSFTANSRVLVATKPLDYEARKEYTVVVRVFGNRGRTNFEVFKITVSSMLAFLLHFT